MVLETTSKKEQQAINNEWITEPIVRRKNNKRLAVDESKLNVRDKEEKDDEYMDEICGEEPGDFVYNVEKVFVLIQAGRYNSS